MKGIKMTKDFCLLSSTGQIDICTGHSSVCTFGQSSTIKLTHVFMVAGWWVTVDFEKSFQFIYINIHLNSRETISLREDLS